MIVKPLITIYCDGKKHEPSEGEFDFPDKYQEQARTLASQGALEIIEAPQSEAQPEVQAEAKVEASPKGKRSG